MLKVVESTLKHRLPEPVALPLGYDRGRAFFDLGQKALKVNTKALLLHCSMRRCARSSEEASRKIFTVHQGIPPFPCRGHRQSDLVIAKRALATQ